MRSGSRSKQQLACFAADHFMARRGNRIDNSASTCVATGRLPAEQLDGRIGWMGTLFFDPGLPPDGQYCLRQPEPLSAAV